MKPIDQMNREELLAIVKQLPATADGVPIVLGMSVSIVPALYDGRLERTVEAIERGRVRTNTDVWWDRSACYSTREAAMSAASGDAPSTEAKS